MITSWFLCFELCNKTKNKLRLNIFGQADSLKFNLNFLWSELIFERSVVIWTRSEAYTKRHGELNL